MLALSPDLTSWLTLAALLLAIFAGMEYVVKRVLIDKKYYGNVQGISRQVYQIFQNADRQASIEHVIYMEDEERDEDFIEGDDNS